MRELTERQEAAKAEPWSVDDAPAEYIERMLRAIVGLELTVERVEGKRKLSQNRSAADIAGVVAGLAGRPGRRPPGGGGHVRARRASVELRRVHLGAVEGDRPISDA